MPLSRRRFLQATALASLAFPAVVRGRDLNSRLQIAHIGCGGKGADDIGQVRSHPKIRQVAFCDVDSQRFGAADAASPGAPHFADYREMFARLGDSLDAIVVSTPDHMHALPALRALELRKHVYLQKPLAHSIGETRALREAARRAGVRTQMGNQIHSASEYRTAVALIRSGRIGKITAVHAWQRNRGNEFTHRTERPEPGTVPPNLAWDLWLGGAPERPYAPDVYHPGNWRDWKDFGGGTLGDFGCHILDPIFTALGLGAPLSAEADNTGVNPETWSTAQTIRLTFQGTALTASRNLVITWYDGGRRPDAALARMPKGQDLPPDGSLIIGEHGTVVVPHFAQPSIYPVETFGVTLSPGDAARRRRKLAAGEKDDRKVADFPIIEGRNHYHDWIDAAMGGPPTTDNFDYASNLTEAVLLGMIATRFPGQTLRWDSANMRFADNPAAQALVNPPYRKGWGG